jgi:predicted DNA-binding transcriptional regulator AlpA
MNTHPHPPEDTTTIEPLMSVVDLAEYLNVTPAAVYLAIKAGRIPPPMYPLSRSPRWRRSEVDEMLAKTRTSPTQARADRRQARLDKQKTITTKAEANQ